MYLWGVEVYIQSFLNRRIVSLAFRLLYLHVNGAGSYWVGRVGFTADFRGRKFLAHSSIRTTIHKWTPQPHTGNGSVLSHEPLRLARADFEQEIGGGSGGQSPVSRAEGSDSILDVDWCSYWRIWLCVCEIWTGLITPCRRVPGFAFLYELLWRRHCVLTLRDGSKA